MIEHVDSDLLKVDVECDLVELEASGDRRRLPPSPGVAVHDVLDGVGLVRGGVGAGRVTVIANLTQN